MASLTHRIVPYVLGDVFDLLPFMISSCLKLHQRTFTSVVVPTISSVVSVVEQFISVVAVYARCLGFIWCDVSDCSYMGLEVNFRRTMIPE